jgi:hypothetical protein
MARERSCTAPTADFKTYAGEGKGWKKRVRGLRAATIRACLVLSGVLEASVEQGDEVLEVSFESSLYFLREYTHRHERLLTRSGQARLQHAQQKRHEPV